MITPKWYSAWSATPTTSEAAVEGGAPLIPGNPRDDTSTRIAYLPGGCWLRIAKAWTRGDGGFETGIELEVGSLAVEAAEVKAISHAFSSDGVLRRVRFSKVVAV